MRAPAPKVAIAFVGRVQSSVTIIFKEYRCLDMVTEGSSFDCVS
jgi:hypothetical protein